MITAIATVVAALWVAGLVTLLVAARRAPKGFEDPDGFHAVAEGFEPREAVRVAIRIR